MSRAAKEVVQRHRLTVANYHRMGEAGIFDEGARVELVEGEVIDMAPIGSKHAAMVARLQKLLERAAGDQAIIWIQNPVVLNDRSEPEPDISLLRQRDDFYEASHPRAKDILLIVEVSDTTARYDREVKMPIYARAGIPEAWVVELEEKQLEVCRQPDNQGYRQVLRPQANERVALALLPHISLPVASLWPSA